MGITSHPPKKTLFFFTFPIFFFRRAGYGTAAVFVGQTVPLLVAVLAIAGPKDRMGRIALGHPFAVERDPVLVVIVGTNYLR
jgi:hypothetical protein